MMARNLDRMAPDVLAAHQRRARDFLDALTRTLRKVAPEQLC